MSMGLPFGPASRITPIRNPAEPADSHLRSLHAHSPPRHLGEPKLHERGNKGHVSPPQLSQSPSRTRPAADEQRIASERAARDWHNDTTSMLAITRSVLDGNDAPSPEAAKQFHDDSSKWLSSYNKQQRGGASAALHGVVLQVTAALSAEDGTLALGDAERAAALRTLGEADKELAREEALHATATAAAAPH